MDNEYRLELVGQDRNGSNWDVLIDGVKVIANMWVEDVPLNTWAIFPDGGKAVVFNGKAIRPNANRRMRNNGVTDVTGLEIVPETRGQMRRRAAETQLSLIAANVKSKTYAPA